MMKESHLWPLPPSITFTNKLSKCGLNVNNANQFRNVEGKGGGFFLNVGDLNAGVGMHGAAFGPGDGLNPGLSGQGAAVAVAAVTSLHGVAVCPQPQGTLGNEKGGFSDT